MAVGAALLGGAIGGAGINIVIRGVDRFSGVFTKASLGIAKVGKIAATGALVMAAAIAGIGIASVKTAADFETAFTGVRKTVELSEAEFEDLENRFKTLTTEIPVTFVELSKIGEIAGQLGVQGVEDIEKFTKVIADISVTTSLTAEAAATDFARFANIMGMSLKDVDRLGAAVVDLGNNFATNETQITEMSMRLAGAGRVVGLTETDVLGLAAALSAVGIEAQMGGSAVSRTMIKIANAVADGGEALDVFAATAGMSAEEFATKWKNEPAKALVILIDGLKETIDEGENVFAVLEELGVQSIRERDALLRLAGAGELVNKTLDVSAKAWEENTALIVEAEKRYATFASQVQILKNESKLLFEDLGKELIPVLVDLFKVIKDDVLPAIKPLISTMGVFLVNAIEKITPILPKLTGLLIKLMEIFMKLWDVIMPLLEPLMEIGFVIFDAILDAIEPLIPAIAALANLLVPLLKLLVPVVEFLAKLLTLIAQFTGGVLTGIFGGIGSIFGGGGRTTTVGDAIIKPSGQIIKTHPQDTLIATRGGGVGMTIIIQDNNIYGTDPNQIAEALQETIANKIGLG